MTTTAQTEQEQAKAKLMAITLDQVQKAYSGKPGCACGCRGKYATASKHEGDGYDAKDVNDRSVKIIYNKMRKLAEAGEAVMDFGSGVAVDLENRVYAIYIS